jgi:hypothetical protein
VNFIPFGELPPEVIAQLREQHEQQHMAVESHIHGYKQFLEGLNADQLKMVRQLASDCQDIETSGHWQGRIVEILHRKFGLCPCGNNHDKDAADLLAEQAPAEVKPLDADLQANLKKKQAAVEEAKGPLSEIQAELLSTPKAELLERYNLEEVEEGIRCIGCQTLVASLEDRMLRPPGVKGCETCQHKTKWG